MECVILAAGYSSRFKSPDVTFKKCMLPFKASNILNYIILALIKSGIRKVNIILDDKTDKNKIINSCNDFIGKTGTNPDKFELNFIRNNYSERENGYSLYLGAKEVSSESFVLSMSDHIFSDNIYSQMVKNYKNQDIVLATDPMKIKGIYDLDDCTKVNGLNSQIKQIGKKIPSYNRLDMGVFIMKTKKVKEISNTIEKEKKKFGVSDILISAINKSLVVSYFDFPNIFWLDVDNDVEYCKLKDMFKDASNFRPFNLVGI